MKDGDGGQSLIAGGIRAVTSADAKQNQLQKELGEVQNRLLQLSRGWVVDPDTNLDREKRLLAAKKVIDWLTADEEAVYYRVHALQESLCIADGEELQLSDCGDVQSRRHAPPLPRQLHNFLHEWATVSVPKRFESYCNSHKEGEPWLDPNDVNAFTRFLRDYLCTETVFNRLVGVLQPVVNLKTRDEAARRHAQRNYVRIILNDYVLNPGPSQVPKTFRRPHPAGRAARRRAAGLQPLRPHGVVRPALGPLPAAGPGPGGRRAHQAPPRQRAVDPYPRTLRK